MQSLFYFAIITTILLVLVLGLGISLNVLLKWGEIDFDFVNVKKLWMRMFIGFSVFVVGYLTYLVGNYFNCHGTLSLVSLVFQLIGLAILVWILYDWAKIYRGAMK